MTNDITDEELGAVAKCQECGGSGRYQNNATCRVCFGAKRVRISRTALAELKAKWQAEATRQLWSHLHTCAICKGSILTPLQTEDVVSCEGCEPHAVFGGDHDDELNDWRDELARRVNPFAKGGE